MRFISELANLEMSCLFIEVEFPPSRVGLHLNNISSLISRKRFTSISAWSVSKEISFFPGSFSRSKTTKKLLVKIARTCCFPAYLPVLHVNIFTNKKHLNRLWTHSSDWLLISKVSVLFRSYWESILALIWYNGSCALMLNVKWNMSNRFCSQAKPLWISSWLFVRLP